MSVVRKDVKGGVWSVGVDDLLEHGHRRHPVRPPGVERELEKGFLQLFIGHAVLPGEGEMEPQLVGLAQRGERGVKTASK